MLPAYIIQKNKSPIDFSIGVYFIQSTVQTLICTFSSLIQTILSVPESHRFGCKKQFTDYTVGREYASSAAPCPEEFLLKFFIVIIFTLSENVNTIWTFSHSFANIISMKISNILRTDKTLDFTFYLIGWICIILALVLSLAWKNGYLLWIFPANGCTLHNLTGYYCPGCGGTRAIYALLHGHVLRSLFYHPIVVYTAVFAGWFMLSQTIEKASRGRLAIGMHYRDIYLWIALAIVLINWLVKNLLLAVFGIALLG